MTFAAAGGRHMTTIRVVVLAVGTVLATWPPLAALSTESWRNAGTVVAWAEASLGEVSATARPGERIGLLVPPVGSRNYQEALWFAAQYALAPAIVEPVLIGDCLGPDEGRCRLTHRGRVVALLPRPEWIVFAEERLGLEPVGPFGAVLLMRTRDPRPQ